MTKKYPLGNGAIKWISTDWLTSHLNDDLIIIDTQPNVHDYIKEHIPGARYMNQSLFRVPLKGLPAQYVPEEVVQSLFRRLGIDKEKSVVVYTGVGPHKGWGDGLEQTMVAYTLARFGHKNVYILDGGIDKWNDENKPTNQIYPKVNPSTFTVDVQTDFMVSFDDVRALKDKKDVVLLDARPADIYAGQGPWRKPGHIPGAVNLPWKSLMDDNNPRLLKPDEEINKLIESVGATKGKTIICSCGTGREATNEFNLFKFYLGFPSVKIYEGSFTEWVANDQETVTGKSPE